MSISSSCIIIILCFPWSSIIVRCGLCYSRGSSSLVPLCCYCSSPYILLYLSWKMYTILQLPDGIVFSYHKRSKTFQRKNEITKDLVDRIMGYILYDEQWLTPACPGVQPAGWFSLIMAIVKHTTRRTAVLKTIRTSSSGGTHDGGSCRNNYIGNKLSLKTFMSPALSCCKSRYIWYGKMVDSSDRVQRFWKLFENTSQPKYRSQLGEGT